MKRLSLALVLVLAATALAAGTGTAGDKKGPPCTDITANGDTDYYNPSATPDLSWTFVLAAPSCDAATYLLDIYNFSGTTLLVDDLAPTGISGNTVSFTYTFDEGTAPSDGVCLVGTTYHKGRLSDSAPDSGCFVVEVGGAGGIGGFG